MLSGTWAGYHPLLPIVRLGLLYVLVCLSLWGSSVSCEHFLVWLFIYLVGVFVGCICVCLYTYMGLCTRVYMWRSEFDFQSCSLSVFRVFVLSQHLSLNLELTEWPGRLASEPRELLTATHCPAHPLKQFLGSEPGFPSLCSKHFSHRTICPAPT